MESAQSRVPTTLPDRADTRAGRLAPPSRSLRREQHSSTTADLAGPDAPTASWLLDLPTPQESRSDAADASPAWVRCALEIHRSSSRGSLPAGAPRRWLW